MKSRFKKIREKQFRRTFLSIEGGYIGYTGIRHCGCGNTEVNVLVEAFGETVIKCFDCGEEGRIEYTSLKE